MSAMNDLALGWTEEQPLEFGIGHGFRVPFEVRYRLHEREDGGVEPVRAVLEGLAKPNALVNPCQCLRGRRNRHLLPLPIWRKLGAAHIDFKGMESDKYRCRSMGACQWKTDSVCPMVSDAPLLVDPPSQHLSGTHPGGELTKASASPNIPPGVSGSNSTDQPQRRVFTQDIIAVCNAPRCGREFPVNSKSDDLPHHHLPDARGLLKPVCHGSGRRATVFAEA